MKWMIPSALVFLSIFTACSTPEKPKANKSVMRVNLGSEPNTLDPRKARDLYSMTLARTLFEGLTRVGQSEKAELALASSLSYTADLKKYTFYLRDAEWSNGDRIVASDFIYAWKKVLDPNFLSDQAFQFYDIKNAKAAKEGKVSVDEVGIRAIDDKTIEVELDHPVPYFLELVALPVFFPVNARIDQLNPNWAQEASSCVSNGPYQLVEWKHQDCIKVKKYAQYWDAKTVQLDELELFMVAQDTTELKMFEKKELDWAGSPLGTIPVEAIASLKKQNLIKTKETLGTYFIRVNTEAAPLQDPKLRKAFALAIDRKAIVDHVTQGNQIPASGLVPLSFGLQKEPYFKDGAVEEARALFYDALSAMHLSKEQLPEIKYTYASNERNHLIAQALEQQWFQAFGIRVKLEGIERKVYFDRLARQDYQLAASSWIADFNDPINFLDVFRYKKGSSNNTNWENSQYIDLLERSSSVANVEERLELLKQSQKVLIEEMPILPIFHYTMLYMQQDHLLNVVLSSLGSIDFKWAAISSNNPQTKAGGEKK